MKGSWLKTYGELFLIGLAAILCILACVTYVFLVLTLLTSGKWAFIGLGVILAMVVICPVIGAGIDAGY